MNLADIMSGIKLKFIVVVYSHSRALNLNQIAKDSYQCSINVRNTCLEDYIVGLYQSPIDLSFIMIVHHVFFPPQIQQNHRNHENFS